MEKTVESGDFVSIDLLATDGGKEIDGGSANEISYEVGSASMIEGLDEALIGLKVSESKSFETALVGMPESQKASVQVTLKAVKKRELPPLDDAFAKLASEFETLAELKADLSNRLQRVKELEQGAQAFLFLASLERTVITSASLSSLASLPETSSFLIAVKTIRIVPERSSFRSRID